MDAAPLFFSVVLLASLVKGQLEPDALQPDLEYERGQFLEDEPVLWKDYIPVQSARERSFAEGLIMEAGMHVLFPEKYAQKEGKGKLKLIEINRGQPELEESYMNEKVRRAKGCPEDCPMYKPVCGSDGKVYKSECDMRKENCGTSSVTSGPWDKCRGKHYLCPSRCMDINDPVCGSDGRIYHNACVMRKRNCGKLIDILPVRRCYDNVRDLESKEEIFQCPEDCLEVYRPVCGSDGVIYYNECYMKKRTCKQGIVQVEMEGCIEVPKCPEVCLPIHDPVCGSDGRLYINHCRMLQTNCGKEIKVVARSVCGYPTKEPPAHVTRHLK